jgi:hypothetical protein
LAQLVTNGRSNCSRAILEQLWLPVVAILVLVSWANVESSMGVEDLIDEEEREVADYHRPERVLPQLAFGFRAKNLRHDPRSCDEEERASSEPERETDERLAHSLEKDVADQSAYRCHRRKERHGREKGAAVPRRRKESRQDEPVGHLVDDQGPRHSGADLLGSLERSGHHEPVDEAVHRERDERDRRERVGQTSAVLSEIVRRGRKLLASRSF